MRKTPTLTILTSIKDWGLPLIDVNQSLMRNTSFYISEDSGTHDAVRAVSTKLPMSVYVYCNTSKLGTNWVPNVDKALFNENCHIYLYRSTLNQRLEAIYQKAKAQRKSTWLFDLDCQPPEELLKILTSSSKYYYNYQRGVAIYGSTLDEDIDIYKPVYDLFVQLYSCSLNS